jgi:hypothetical protein
MRWLAQLPFRHAVLLLTGVCDTRRYFLASSRTGREILGHPHMVMLSHRGQERKGMRAIGEGVTVKGVKMGARCHGPSSPGVASIARGPFPYAWSLASRHYLNKVLSVPRGAAPREVPPSSKARIVRGVRSAGASGVRDSLLGRGAPETTPMLAMPPLVPRCLLALKYSRARSRP